MYFLVYAIFMQELQKIFSLRDMIHNNVQIFSPFMQLFMGHIVLSLHLLKERIIFFHVYPQRSF